MLWHALPVCLIPCRLYPRKSCSTKIRYGSCWRTARAGRLSTAKGESPPGLRLSRSVRQPCLHALHLLLPAAAFVRPKLCRLHRAARVNHARLSAPQIAPAAFCGLHSFFSQYTSFQFFDSARSVSADFPLIRQSVFLLQAGSTCGRPNTAALGAAANDNARATHTSF